MLEVGNVEIIMCEEAAELTEELKGDDLKEDDGKEENEEEKKDESEDENRDENEDGKNDENLGEKIDGNDVKMLNSVYDYIFPSMFSST